MGIGRRSIKEMDEQIARKIEIRENIASIRRAHFA